ncbi:apolipoprotein L6-like [Monodelphis domestica]|nr:apolipoprotein L6-like [Monodelphis domestica]
MEEFQARIPSDKENNAQDEESAYEEGDVQDEEVPHEEEDTLDEEEIALEDFEKMKEELEECIQKLHAMADEVDKTHKNCTIAKVVSNSTGIVSGVLTILGIALVPVTLGGSLGLTIAGVSLGSASGITNLLSNGIDHIKGSRMKKRVKHMMAAYKGKLPLQQQSMIDQSEEREVVGKIVRKGTSVCVDLVSKIKKDIIPLTKARSGIASVTERIGVSGSTSVKASKAVQSALGGTVVGMTKGIKVFGIVTGSVGILMDTYFLIKESRHLLKGSKAKTANELRQAAQSLEESLEKLCKQHEAAGGQ